MVECTPTEVADKRHLLDAFLVDNQELEALNARLAAFNLFRVLRIERAEIRHSNVLAWLLTPGETHGLGATFLRRFLSRLLLENEEVKIALTPAQVELMDFTDVEVYREWQNIDVLVSSRSGSWCLLIENKIGGRESTKQLLRYVETVSEKKPGSQIIRVLLTLEGDEPSEAGRAAGYIPLSHVQVLELAERIVEQNAARVPPDAAVFLKHYLDTLRRLTMQDEQLVDLCKQIYRKHREAIDLIVEYAPSSAVLDAVQEQVAAMVACEFITSKRGLVWFLPAEMGKHLPIVKLTDWTFLNRKVPVMWWFQYWKKGGKLGVVLEVGPMDDGTTRQRLLRDCGKAGFSFSKQAFKEGAKFTRILSRYEELTTNEDGEADEDPEYVKELTRSLWTKAWKEGCKITDVLKNFEWKTRAVGSN